MKLANRTDAENSEIAMRFSSMSDLTIEQIDFILQHKQGHYNKNDYQLKRDGLLKEPTTFEKTLTVTQLFMLNNPLWTLGLSKNNL